jgi:hypothetical protein
LHYQTTAIVPENNLSNVTATSWVVVFWTLVDKCQGFGGTYCILVYDSDYFEPENGSSMFLRNIDNNLTYYPELHLSRSKIAPAAATKAHGEGKVHE